MTIKLQMETLDQTHGGGHWLSPQARYRHLMVAIREKHRLRHKAEREAQRKIDLATRKLDRMTKT